MSGPRRAAPRQTATALSRQDAHCASHASPLIPKPASNSVAVPDATSSASVEVRTQDCTTRPRGAAAAAAVQLDTLCCLSVYSLVAGKEGVGGAAGTVTRPPLL